ncbi:MAG: aminopeptidase [Nitrososphaeria archaeon]
MNAGTVGSLMVDSRLTKLAKLCFDYSVEVKAKEKVVIERSVQALPLMRELYRECPIRGAYPHILPNPEILDLFFRHANRDQLTFVSPFSKYMMENVEVHIGIFCESNPKYLSNADPEKMAVYSAARRKLMDVFMKRTSEKKLRWNEMKWGRKAE